jgi:hypothetical protein
MKSTKAEIIFAAAAEYAGKIPDLSFTKLRPEIQEFVSGKHDISKLFGILTIEWHPQTWNPTCNHLFQGVYFQIRIEGNFEKSCLG